MQDVPTAERPFFLCEICEPPVRLSDSNVANMKKSLLRTLLEEKKRRLKRSFLALRVVRKFQTAKPLNKHPPARPVDVYCSVKPPARLVVLFRFTDEAEKLLFVVLYV